jgi:hypothetical protein
LTFTILRGADFERHKVCGTLLSIASEFFHPKLLPKFLMDYGAGWGDRTDRDGTAPPVLDIHLGGEKRFLTPFHDRFIPTPFHPPVRAQ